MSTQDSAAVEASSDRLSAGNATLTMNRSRLARKTAADTTSRTSPGRVPRAACGSTVVLMRTPGPKRFDIRTD
ncbi:hypothetical protein [Blastococcus sp. SYSU DS0541]